MPKSRAEKRGHRCVNHPTDQDALDLINRICGDDFCEDVDMRYATMAPTDPDLKIALEKLSAVYRIAHSMVRSKVCYHVHEDWRQAILNWDS